MPVQSAWEELDICSSDIVNNKGLRTSRQEDVGDKVSRDNRKATEGR